jgi:LPXTG-site transpeptidase (sortase) family protein
MCYHIKHMEVHSWNDFVDAVLLRKVAFLVTFFVVFILSYAVLAWLDFLPELVTKPDTEPQTEVLEEAGTGTYPIATVATSTVEEPEAPEVVAPVYPLSITIEAINKTVTVLNPTSREVADLDAALLEGVVRHPDSASLEQNGTVFILGHSSYLPAVRNRNFQAFNGIQDLKWGDTIVLGSADAEYIYRVDKVYRASAQDVTVPIAGPTQRLVLATCNSFGSVDDRYIVEADLIEVVAK